MNKDQVEGTLENVTGQAQEGFGNMADDPEHKMRGMARQVAGRAQHAYGDARDYAQQAGERAREYASHAGERVVRQVEQQPVTTLLIVGAVGYVLGLLTARR
ncbi:CsbD family protein [Teichococcus oryzae]|nr:CsbD family protein [Pseudoroseomonas oryzae]